MAEIVDFGLQQHKIKMDGRFFENALTVVAGDTARRLEVQLLDTNNMVQDTTGLKLRLNAVVSGKATYTDAVLVDATKGLYHVDLTNGMLLVPGNWQFQWQIIDASDKKLHSFAFTGSVGSNLSEGGSEATNFYLNADELKQMQDDLINGTFDSEVLETNIAEKLTDLEEQYAPRLNEVNAQLAQKASINYVDAILMDIAKGGPRGPFNSINDLNTAYPYGVEGTWLVFDSSFTDGAHSFMWDSTNSIWKDLGVYQATGIADKSITPDHTNFIYNVSLNLYNFRKAKVGKAVSVSGTIVDNPALAVTGEIRVEENTHYSSNDTDDYTVGFYTGGKVFISQTVGKNFTTPPGTQIIIKSFDKTLINTFMLVEGETPPSKYVSFDEYKLDENIIATGKKEHSDYIERKSRNLFDDSKIYTSKWDSGNGSLSPSDNYNVGFKIPVKPNNFYITNAKTGATFPIYNEQGVNVMNHDNKKGVAFKTPSDAAFISINVHRTLDTPINQYMLVEGTLQPLTFIPFKEYEFDKDIKIPSNSKWVGCEYGAIGDSITELLVDTPTLGRMNYLNVVKDNIPFSKVKKIGYGGHKMSQLLDILAYNNITESDLLSMSVCTVFLGTNDKYSAIGTIDDPPSLTADNIHSNVKGIIEYLLNINPRLKIGFVTPLNGVNYRKDLNNAIKDSCALYGVKVLDLYSTSGINPLTYSTYYADAGTHLNYDGNIVVGEEFVNFLNIL